MHGKPETIKCLQCGIENRATLFFCEHCKTNLHLACLPKKAPDTIANEVAQLAPQTEEPKPEISLGRRFTLIAIAWAATAVLTLPGIFFPQMFPAGLVRLFGVRENELIDGPWLGVGWLVYVTLTAVAFLTRRKHVYFVIYTVLCILLLLNSAGCRMYWSELKDVH